MFAKAIVPLALFAVTAQAIQITNPTNSTGWESSGSQLIEWDSVSTDPGNFSIYISQPGSSAKQVIQKDVQTSDHSFIYTPTKDIQPASGYQISFISNDNSNGILAQSNQFEVKQGQSTLSATSTASLTTTDATTASPTAASTTQSGTQSTQSAASSSAAAQSSGASSAGEIVAVPSGILLFVAAFAALFA
ncbi:uncharacterized protein I206_104555 [Kwoniella pini CBS 10737]|uniref:Yeast cell wall synthesis Kre9/Knh1-like N-terminal domain-containing protein n=1 Tax=Kwoniella pini CBS 10737 TaxID=1296096 RepID=A0A1B9I757_9TREE|nr:uncharacterized protein I206_02089 [Kwoniella pini CBS 10737]OCF51375.1 hypothetical protein I206_02089 [Kwoniella pini CBS 10737]